MNKKTIIGIFSTVACLILLLSIPWLLLWIFEGNMMNLTGWRAKDLYLICALLEVIIILSVPFAIPYFFESIPTNHFVCVEVKGKFQHILGHKCDVNTLCEYMQKNPDQYKSSPFSIDQLIAREDHWFLGLFVRFFNLHFKSIFPYASLREVKVTRRRINPTSTNGDSLETMIVPSEGSTGEEESTPYLRFELPRAAYMRNLELRGQVLVHLVVYITRLRLTHLYEAFYGHSDVSAWLDLQLTSALSSFCGPLGLDEFANTDLTPNPGSKFSKFMRGDPSSNPLTSGLRAIGIQIIGGSSVVAYQLAGSEATLIKARKEQEIAAIGVKTATSEAEAASIGTMKAGEAEAHAIRARGEAEAGALKAKLKAKTDGAKELKEALGAPELVATVLQNEALAGGSIHTFVTGASAAPSVMIGGTGNGQSSVPPPTSMTSGNAGISTKPTPAGKAPTNDTSTSGNTTGNGGDAPPDDSSDNDGDDDDDT